MARDYARIMTAIWRNPEFRALDEAPQRAYLLLVTQPEISAVGVLALRLRRWADMAKDTTAESLSRSLKELESGRFIVVDWDSEELLIRSFIRWDGGYNNPKRRPVIVRDAADVVSQSIARSLVAEFQRCGIPTGPGTPPGGPSGRAPDRPAHSLSGSPSEINSHDRDNNPFPHVDSLYDGLWASDRVVVTYSSMESATLEDEKSTTPAASRNTSQMIIGEWIDGCRKRPPKSVIGQTSKLIKQLLEDGLDPDDIRHGVELWRTKGLHPSALPSVVNELMNARPNQARRANRRPTTDDKVAEWQMLKTGTDGGAAIYELSIGDSQ